MQKMQKMQEETEKYDTFMGKILLGEGKKQAIQRGDEYPDNLGEKSSLGGYDFMKDTLLNKYNSSPELDQGVLENNATLRSKVLEKKYGDMTLINELMGNAEKKRKLGIKSVSK